MNIVEFDDWGVIEIKDLEISAGVVGGSTTNTGCVGYYVPRGNNTACVSAGGSGGILFQVNGNGGNGYPNTQSNGTCYGISIPVNPNNTCYNAVCPGT